MTFFPVTLVYGVALINALSNLLVEHLHITAISRGPLSFIVVAALYVVLSKGRDRVVAIMSALALPFAASVLLIAVSLIPGWHLSNLTDTAAEMNATPLPEKYLADAAAYYLLVLLCAYGLPAELLLPGEESGG